MSNHQLYGVNKRLLDPRRPVGPPTADDKEEMLIPYRPVLDFNPKESASYTLEIAGIDSIKSSPSYLESTSLVISYGLDIFFTRRQPSKSFDKLSDDFNYVALIGTILALIVGIYVAKYFAERKKLLDSWR